MQVTLNIIFRCISGENWQPNMVLDDGGDATHLLVKKFNSIFKVGTFKVYMQMNIICLTDFIVKYIDYCNI